MQPLEICESCQHILTAHRTPVPGVLAAFNWSDGTYHSVDRCDTCERFGSDVEAAQALLDAGYEPKGIGEQEASMRWQNVLTKKELRHLRDGPNGIRLRMGVTTLRGAAELFEAQARQVEEFHGEGAHRLPMNCCWDCWTIERKLVDAGKLPRQKRHGG